VSKPEAGEAQPAALGWAVEQDLGDGKADQLGVGDLRAPSRACAPGQQVVGEDVERGKQGVEVWTYGHETDRSRDGFRAASAHHSPAQVGLNPFR
jgi:hypothetical protein